MDSYCGSAICFNTVSMPECPRSKPPLDMHTKKQVVFLGLHVINTTFSKPGLKPYTCMFPWFLRKVSDFPPTVA